MIYPATLKDCSKLSPPSSIIVMYRFRAQRDQQQATTLTAAKCTVPSSSQQPTHRPHHPHRPRSSPSGPRQYPLCHSDLNIDFTIHENQEQSSKWSALEHSLKTQFEDIVATELLPTSTLRTHIFVLSQDADIESVIFNTVWLCLVLHGTPLRRSIYCHQWTKGHESGKVILDVNAPETVLAG